MRLLRTREGSRGLPLSDFRASVPLRRVGPEETAAERIPSILWSRRTSRASNTRSALTTRRWCSTPLKEEATPGDRKSTRLNSSHGYISYAVFCLKKKKYLKPGEPDSSVEQ